MPSAHSRPTRSARPHRAASRLVLIALVAACHPSIGTLFEVTSATESGTSIGTSGSSSSSSTTGLETTMGGGDADTDTTDSTGTTEACEPAYVVTDHECPHFSAADGEGPGGGETLSSCAKVDTKSGHLQVFVRKWYGADDPVFEDRPYMIRVSGVDTDPCGPDAFYFVISNDTPTGIGTDQLVFTFSSTWLDDQGPKGYCVTAALLPDEPEYIEGTPHNQSWWFSDKFWLESVCE